MQAAKEGWLRWARLENDDDLSQKYGTCRQDLPKSQLRDPRKIVDIDYESYQPGSDILAMLHKESSGYRSGFEFSVYIDNRRVGTVLVSSQDQKWIVIGTTGVGSDPVDVYAKIYSQYPPSEDLIIYQRVDDGAFFMIKNGRVIDSFYGDLEAREFKEMDPARYIMKEKAGIENYKKSDLYKHYLEIKKQLHEDSLKVKHSS